MKSCDVFEEKQELARLEEQNQLISQYEMPVYQSVMSDFENIKLLDIGCNDGTKTFDRFSNFNVEKVIGIECSEKLVKKAQDKFGGDKFSFYCCNVEDDSFIEKMTAIMKDNKIDRFEVINISFVLLHIDDPEKVLKSVRSLLSEKGKIVIVEADDSASTILPDKDGLFKKFLDILSHDPLAGNRAYCHRITTDLTNSGFNIVKELPITVSATETQTKMKKMIFNVFCSYVPEDYSDLVKQNADNSMYRNANIWLLQNYEKLRTLVMSDKVSMSMGIRMFVCSVKPKNELHILQCDDCEFYLEELSQNTVQAALDMCDYCVGKNMYSLDYLESVLHNPNHRFYLLKNKNEDIIGYTYFYLTDLEDMAEFTRTSKEQLSVMSRNKKPVIGNTRSIGIVDKYRHRHLGVELMRFSIEEMKKMNADIVFGAFWKTSSGFPMAASLKEFGFKHLMDVHNIWYNNEKLYCPVCKGRCKCDAALYYINIGENEQ